MLVVSALVRNKAAAASPSVVAWLDKTVKPGLASARRGGITLQEQQACPAFAAGHAQCMMAV
jgi:hypothetical protein